VAVAGPLSRTAAVGCVAEGAFTELAWQCRACNNYSGLPVTVHCARTKIELWRLFFYKSLQKLNLAVPSGIAELILCVWSVRRALICAVEGVLSPIGTSVWCPCSKAYPVWESV
jgi:hypothetical protein